MNRTIQASQFELKILGLLSTERYTTARILAEQVWKRKCNGAGQWQRMGAVLRRLKERGLVSLLTTEQGQNTWRRRRSFNKGYEMAAQKKENDERLRLIFSARPPDAKGSVHTLPQAKGAAG